MGTDPSVLAQLAAAYMERERHRAGIPKQEQDAAEDSRRTLLVRAQAEKIAQEIGMAPAAQEAQIGLQDAQTEYYRAGGRAQTQQPPSVGSFEDYLRQRYGDRPTSAQIEEGRKTYQQVDDRPRQPPISLSLPIAVWDNQTKQMTYVTKEEALANKGRYTPPPTTAERNVASGSTAAQQTQAMSRARALPVLQDLGSRVLQANKGLEGGLMDRMGGAARGFAGKMGMDSAADLYNTGVRGFVPLFARSVGHVGVLTELDVKRTEDLFPRFGADAPAVVEEKLARLNRIMTGQEPMPFQFEMPEYDEQGITQPAQTEQPPPLGPSSPGGPSAAGAPGAPRRLRFDAQGNQIK